MTPNNLTEKLELMQWLHQQGLQPEMWVYSGRNDPLRGHITPTRDGSKQYAGRDFIGWFPLEQVLGLLPDWLEIECGGKDRDYHLDALQYLKEEIERNPEAVKNERV